MKPSDFKKNIHYFHLNMHFDVTGYFKELDWIRLQKILAAEGLTYGIEIQALVMMDTHFHLLFSCPPNKENFFCENVHQKLNGSQTHSSHCEPIDSVSQYLNTYKYIYNNPVHAGICDRAEDYTYSSIRSLLGFSAGHCLVADKLKLIQNPYQTLTWINTEQLNFKISNISDQNGTLKVFSPA